MALVSELQLRKFSTVFHFLDRNKNQVLDWEDFCRGVYFIRKERGWSDGDPRLLNLLQAYETYWQKMLALCDEDENGVITLYEFLRLHEQVADEIRESGRVPSWALQLFQDTHRALDIDGDGSITQDEYALHLRSIDSDADPRAAFLRLDLNHDGGIDIAELEQLYQQFIMSNDPNSSGNWLWVGKY